MEKSSIASCFLRARYRMSTTQVSDKQLKALQAINCESLVDPKRVKQVLNHVTTRSAGGLISAL
jgi:hypothetical protein